MKFRLPHFKQVFQPRVPLQEVSVVRGTILAVPVRPFEVLAAKVHILDLDRRPDSVFEDLAANHSILDVWGDNGCFSRSGGQKVHLPSFGSQET